MIADVLRIKQYKTQRQAREVRQCEETLADKREALEKGRRALEEFIQWQAKEVARLYAQLSRKPATLLELETFNQEVADLHAHRQVLAQEHEQLRTEAAAAEEALRGAIEELRTREKNQLKFEHLADELSLVRFKEEQKKEQNLADEAASDSFRAGGRPSLASRSEGSLP